MSKIEDRCRRYELEEPYHLRSPHLNDIEFDNEWATIQGGEMVISRGYSWDGCSPAYFVPVFGWIGPPDGKRDADGIPQAYYASLVHDVLCQWRGEIDICKEDTLAIFYGLLLAGGFEVWRAKIYVWFVRHFGPQEWLGDTRHKRADAIA